MGGLEKGFDEQSDSETPAYDEEHERLLGKTQLVLLDGYIAKVIKKEITNEITWEVGRRIGIPFSLLDALKSLEVRKRLVPFALKRRISLTNPTWEDVAIWVAATEHVELANDRRPRRRPRKDETLIDGPLGQLLGVTNEFFTPELERIEAIQQSHAVEGKRMSDAAACRLVVETDFGKRQEEHKAARVKTLTNKVSSQRATRDRNRALAAFMEEVVATLQPNRDKNPPEKK